MIDRKYGPIGFGFVAFFLSLLGTVVFSGLVVAQAPSDRFGALEDHILGSDSMSVAEFENWATAFAGEAGTLGNRLNDFVAAVEIVELYEDRIGPLFTAQGQVSFGNSWEGDFNVDRALARAMLGVYQAIFDAYDNDLVSQQSNLVQGVMFRSTENFPGSVPNPSNPAAVYSVRIDGTYSEEFGSDGGYNTNDARRMTGAYLAPGTIVDVVVPDELVNAGFHIRVGGHSWDLRNKSTANRLHRVSNVFDIDGNQVQVANPMGGNIYIEVPVGANVGLVQVEFRGAIRAPFFSDRSFDKTSRNEWENVERFHPGVFTDIESEHTMWTVPSKWVDDLGYDDLMEIIEAHDANIQVASEYVGKNMNRHKAILYMIVDTQIRANVFSIGYPQSNYVVTLWIANTKHISTNLCVNDHVKNRFVAIHILANILRSYLNVGIMSLNDLHQIVIAKIVNPLAGNRPHGVFTFNICEHTRMKTLNVLPLVSGSFIEAPVREKWSANRAAELNLNKPYIGANGHFDVNIASHRIGDLHLVSVNIKNITNTMQPIGSALVT